MTTVPHKERAHSKFSASGAERWFNCPGSVELSEGQPDKSSVWSLEGTAAHEILETILKHNVINHSKEESEMVEHGLHAAQFIKGVFNRTSDAELEVESRITLDFIHPEMFGTYDGAVIDFFGTLHVFDYKYGKGHAVTPKGNLQMIFYGIGLAHRYNWNFKNVRLWIIQPRIRGYDGPLYWEMDIMHLKSFVPLFKKAVKNVLENPKSYREGSWCHWCKAKKICPLKLEARTAEAVRIFSANNFDSDDYEI